MTADVGEGDPEGGVGAGVDQPDPHLLSWACSQCGGFGRGPVLTNLLDNALRHTPDGGTVALNARSDG